MIAPISLYTVNKLSHYKNANKIKETPDESDAVNPESTDVPTATNIELTSSMPGGHEHSLIVTEDEIIIYHNDNHRVRSRYLIATGEIGYDGRPAICGGSCSYFERLPRRDDPQYADELYWFARDLAIILENQPESVREEVLGRLPVELKDQYDKYYELKDLWNGYLDMVRMVAKDFENMPASVSYAEFEEVNLYGLTINQDGASTHSFSHVGGTDQTSYLRFNSHDGSIERQITIKTLRSVDISSYNISRSNSEYPIYMSDIIRTIYGLLAKQSETVREEIIDRLPGELKAQYDLFCIYADRASDIFPGVTPGSI
jgi:hypothetical protein